jgi:outer membrane receptor for ferrienterochelin and colicin
MLKKLAVILSVVGFSFGFTFTLFAQNNISVNGTISDAETGEPLLYANIALTEPEMRTLSDEKGEFSFPSIPPGTYTLLVTHVGYAEYSITSGFTENRKVTILLKKQSLGLKEVTVTAENSKGGTTSSLIKSQAIGHVQASGIKDIMQLVPGNISQNPDLANPAKISIREVGTDINSALGTAIVIDNIPLSNNGNMQKSIKSGGGISTVAGTGIDLRSIPVENIESITVDVGIPSAEYGDLTSGAVHIKTKTGSSAYHVKLQTDPHTKQAYLAKGSLLKNNRGLINIDLGYTQSYQNLVKQTDLYKRINTTAKYSNTFFREKSPLTINLKLDFLNSLDGKKWDPDMILEEEHYSHDREIRSNVTASWTPGKPFLSNVSFSFGWNKTWQEGFEKTWEQSAGGPNFFPTATNDGEYEVSFGPSAYYSEVNYDGRPFSLYSKLKAKLLRKTGQLTNSFLFGAEWRTTGNNGEGRIFNPEKPPAGTGNRPRPFTDIPSLQQFSLFAEDNILWKIGLTKLNVTAGLRFDNIQPAGVFKTNGSVGFDPRINIRYTVLTQKNSSFFYDLSFRIGYGQSTKAPTLLHLYPDKKYNDIESFNYYPDLVVFTTDVVENTRNYNLSPSTGNKYETGIDFQIEKIEGRITLFYEKYKGGFTQDQILYPVQFRDYSTVGAGLSPYYITGEGVYYNQPETGDPVKVDYKTDVRFESYNVFRNADRRVKKGVEYSLNTGTIDAIRTSFNIAGAWFCTESYNHGAPYWERIYYTVYDGNTSMQKSFAVQFEDRYGYGNVAQRLNTSFSIINHIPELRMLVSINTQVIWFEKDRRKIYPGKYQLYSLPKLREHLNNPDLFASENTEEYYYLLPVSYKFDNNIEHEYSAPDFEETLHQQAIKKLAKFRFQEEVYPVLLKCDLKISKDIGHRFNLSFYANNFLNIRPWYLTKRDGRYVRRNQVPYFGADIKMQF